jgi:hypothetical protein
MPEESGNTADLFENHPDHPVDAAAETRPGAERTGPKDLRGGRVCSERWKHAALALPGNPRS